MEVDLNTTPSYIYDKNWKMNHKSNKIIEIIKIIF